LESFGPHFPKVNMGLHFRCSKSFLTELFPGFHMGRFLPFLELPDQYRVVKSGALFPAPLPMRADIFPAMIAPVQRAGIAGMHRLEPIFHKVIVSPEFCVRKRKIHYEWIGLDFDPRGGTF